MEWISVKDRLPEKTPIITFWSDGKYTVFDEDDLISVIGDGEVSTIYGRIISTVTHWAELPEPPKKPIDQQSK